MPSIGEIQYRFAQKRFARICTLKDGTKKLYEYYLPYRRPYVWAACENCGECRWVQVEHNRPRHSLCQRCGTQGHLAELGMATRFPKSNATKIKETRPRIRCEIHPYAHGDGRVLRSHIVMERHLGRYLSPEEVVHHIDGNHFNDDISNLMLFPNLNEHMKHHYNLRMQAILGIDRGNKRSNQIEEGSGLSLPAPRS
jgi:hypothetical protein